MQAAQDMMASAKTSIIQKPASLRQFARFGALAFGVVAGVSASASAISAKQSAYQVAIAKRDEKIATLTAENDTLKNPKSDEITSSGDPIQDWIDSLGK